MDTKYQILVQILDGIRAEARGTDWENRYACDSHDEDAINAARSRAYIHLYLKVMFGLNDFRVREGYVTDGPSDGGIDGFYVDYASKRIYLIQLKFRTNQKNFEDKKIDPSELLAMDVDRITAGHITDERGHAYNGKIRKLIETISKISDIARYNYYVHIIANCDISGTNLQKLTGGHKAEVFSFARAYRELVFPVLNGTAFKAADIVIQLDLSNKSAGAKTNYAVTTPAYDCEITVLFVPAMEIAKVMDQYRNSILEYNPRSYLDLDGKAVNKSIRETVLRPDSNEFALMNNGLTVLSDETNLNEKIGVRNKAQLMLLNPQILNGGQTAYTLSRVFNENREGAAKRLEGKEVLMKVITLTPKDSSADNASERRRLIDEISAATNRQTTVITTDRFSNESVHLTLQRLLFERYGLLYERKRGEFSDGLLADYIDRSQILDRALFMRILLTVYGRIARAVKKKIFAEHGLSDDELLDPKMLDQFQLGYELFGRIAPRNTNIARKYRDTLAKVYIGVSMITLGSFTSEEVLDLLDVAWIELLRSLPSDRKDKYTAFYVDREITENRTAFSPEKWMNSGDFQRDLVDFVKLNVSGNSPWEKFRPMSELLS